MGELDAIGLKTGTDKASSGHDYCRIYESYLKGFKDARIGLFELGVGGYEFVDRGGESARMWYQYFKHGKIITLDLYEKHGIINDRTEFFQGSQDDENLLRSIMTRIKDKDVRIVIDDASHVNKLTIRSFKILFPLLKSGDYYFIEDVHTSYWDDNYGGNEKPGADGTAMQFFSSLTHQLNHETLLPDYRNEYSGQIEFIHFYKELIVIKRL